MEQSISREEIGIQHLINNNLKCSLIPNTTMTNEKSMPPVKKNIWELNVGNIISMLVIVVSMAISYAKTEERIVSQAEIYRINFEIVNKSMIRMEKNIDDIQNKLSLNNFALRDEKIAQLSKEVEEIKKRIRY